VQRLATEAEGAFVVPFRRYFSSLNGFFQTHGVPFSDAEDLAISSLVFVWRRPPDPMADEWIYLHWVARRELSNYYRSTRRRERLMSSMMAASPTSPTSYLRDAHEGLTDDLRLGEAEVTRAFRALPRSQQEVLQLAVLDGRSHHDAAVLLGCSVNAFDCRLLRAKRALRARMNRSKR
jgi:RNA polymerase sigma-70 factor (ECF subfamily)